MSPFAAVGKKYTVSGAVDTELYCQLGSRTRRELTAEALRALSKVFLIKKYSDLCELRVSAVNTVYSIIS